MFSITTSEHENSNRIRKIALQTGSLNFWYIIFLKDFYGVVSYFSYEFLKMNNMLGFRENFFSSIRKTIAIYLIVLYKELPPYWKIIGDPKSSRSSPRVNRDNKSVHMQYVIKFLAVNGASKYKQSQEM